MTLTRSRIRALAQLLLDIGNIFFASLFLGPLLDRPNFGWLALGAIFTASSWVMGIKLIKE